MKHIFAIFITYNLNKFIYYKYYITNFSIIFFIIINYISTISFI